MSAAPNAPMSAAEVLAKKRRKRPDENKFHVGNGDDGKHYWLTPPQLMAELSAKYGPFDFDPCPYPKPEDFDGLTCEWGKNSYVNPPFGSIMHQGRKKGPTAWVRKAIEQAAAGKRVTFVYPIDKWVLMLLAAGAKVSNLGDVRWLATEDGSEGKGTGRHIACFVLGEHPTAVSAMAEREAALVKEVEALRADAERWRWLRDLKCCSMTVSRNEGHAPNYMDLSEWIASQPELYADVKVEELERMKAAGEDWAVQIYPHTPIGFAVYHGATLDAAIDAARAESGHD